MNQWLEYNQEQSRQYVDVQMVHAELLTSRAELEKRFAGTMQWVTVDRYEYLRRKIKGVVKYEGRRSAETEATKKTFDIGKTRAQSRVKELEKRLDEMAPVNRALRLARVPDIVERIVSKIAKADASDTITIVGTNALFAYEAAAAIMLSSGVTATADIDLLYDARRSLRLITEKVRAAGLIGLLKKADSSFTRRERYRAVNDRGYMVDLIEPPSSDVLRRPANRIGRDGDLEAVEIQGLQWLINAPKISQMVISQSGYPFSLRVADPRVWSLHKLWLATREDRESRRRERDRLQGLAVIDMIKSRRLRPGFDKADDLSALPLHVRELLP